ncbi:MAG: putative beta-lactamase-inhibitor-like, PepSY-like [Bacteroidota bacterium]|jgi:hypothetical protein
MKNFVKFSAVASILILFACNKQEDVTVNTPDANTLITTELLLAPAAPADSAHKDGGRVCGGGHGRGEGGHQEGHASGAQGDSIPFAQLPQAAQTYIKTNAATLTVAKIVKVTLPDGTIRYAVRFTDGTHYHFDANGALLATPTHPHAFDNVKFDSLPAAARTYLLAHTDTALINHIIKITEKNGTVLYGVRLNNNTHYFFDANGAIVPEPRRKPR